jgi:hypothetical protein
MTEPDTPPTKPPPGFRGYGTTWLDGAEGAGRARPGDAARSSARAEASSSTISAACTSQRLSRIGTRPSRPRPAPGSPEGRMVMCSSGPSSARR